MSVIRPGLTRTKVTLSGSFFAAVAAYLDTERPAGADTDRVVVVLKGPTRGRPFEAICENCSFSQTSIEFRPTLQAQHDDAVAKGQHHRADLFNQLLTGITQGEAS